MKRSLEAHFTLILALCDIYVTKRICDHDNKEDLMAAVESFRKNFALKADSEFQCEINSSSEKLHALKLSDLFNRSYIIFKD